MKFLSRDGLASLACGGLLFSTAANAIALDINSQDSIKKASKIVADGMLNYYLPKSRPGFVPGLLPEPYYWWEAGAMFGALIDYFSYTKDDSYNDLIKEALLFQVGANDDYMPANQTKTEGNDDQGFWALAAMTAAEANFPNPPADKPQWLALVQAVFNLQANRWDTTSCAGGLKWQIFAFNNGYNYKNSISQGCFFNIAARLGAYTGNNTYFEWANKMWDWTERVKLISDDYSVYDGTDDLKNCSDLNHIQWSYNSGVFLYGAAVMYNMTNGTTQAMWKSRVEGLIRGADLFFTGENKQIMYEQACEPQGNCNIDQASFKAYLSRWMAATTKVAPFTHDILMPRLRRSAIAAAQSCVGGADGVTCGMRWTQTGWDGKYGVGEQMSALEVIQSNLIDNIGGPLSNSTGGTSIGNPSAGTGRDSNPFQYGPITTGDRAGAGILTAMVLVGTVGGGWWLIS